LVSFHFNFNVFFKVIELIVLIVVAYFGIIIVRNLVFKTSCFVIYQLIRPIKPTITTKVTIVVTTKTTLITTKAIVVVTTKG